MTLSTKRLLRPPAALAVIDQPLPVTRPLRQSVRIALSHAAPPHDMLANPTDRKKTGITGRLRLDGALLSELREVVAWSGPIRFARSRRAERLRETAYALIGG